jgi:hypothetical protein
LGWLRTIADACRYMTALPKHREMKQAWQCACRLILERAPVEAVRRQLSLALFTDAALDLRRAGSGRKPLKGAAKIRQGEPA